MKGSIATLVGFAALEAAIRAGYWLRNSMVTEVPLPYVIGQDYGPMPPWLDRVLIRAPGSAVMWSNRPNLRRRYVNIFSPAHSDQERVSLLRRFIPGLPDSFRRNPVWEIALNAEGYRDVPLRQKRPSTFRILCLGDSWTFGVNADQPQAYPQRLGALLAAEFPEADFEVLNRGVLGYSTYQGLQLLKSRIQDWDPDLVVIGFAMNDASISGVRDKDAVRAALHPTLRARIDRILQKNEVYRLLNYFALVVRHEPRPLGDFIKEEADSAPARGTFDFTPIEPWTRVSPEDYEQNVLEMIRIARVHGASVILLFNELWEESPYRARLEKIASRTGTPIVNSSGLIADARREQEARLEKMLDLEPVRGDAVATGHDVEVVFRVYAGATPVPKAIFIVGAHPNLGALVPNKIAMYDDGTHGDQRTGDAVWTYSAAFAPGTRLAYVYTNSGRAGAWEGLDVPHIREGWVEGRLSGTRIYRPIESFGTVYMQGDSWHPDASGYELIARKVFETVERSDRVKAYLRERALQRRGH